MTPALIASTQPLILGSIPPDIVPSALSFSTDPRCKVENSVLFRGVHIGKGAHVKNCIIMQDGQIHSGAYIENCILDKQAIIKRNARLIGPAEYPIVIPKKVTVNR